MTRELVLALFIMGIGLSIAGAGTHLYQFVTRVPAALGFSGRSYLASLGNLAVSFVCGPYLMLQMGWKAGDSMKASALSVLVASFVAFGWAFITGLLFLSLYLAILWR